MGMKFEFFRFFSKILDFKLSKTASFFNLNI
jgi:hypothetical protein